MTTSVSIVGRGSAVQMVEKFTCPSCPGGEGRGILLLDSARKNKPAERATRERAMKRVVQFITCTSGSDKNMSPCDSTARHAQHERELYGLRQDFPASFLSLRFSRYYYVQL